MWRRRAIGILCAASMLGGNSTFAQQRTTAIYGDWTLSCVMVATGGKTCGLVQTRRVGNQSSPISEIGIGRTTQTDPLKVSIQIKPDAWMPSGVKLIGDGNGTIITAIFKWCTSARCVADTDLSDTDIKSLRGQKNPGKLVYTTVSQADVSIPISFSGFSDALDALQNEYARDSQQSPSSQSPNAIESALIDLQTLRRSLPNDVPIDANILRMVQTDPFFQNGAPVRVTGYQGLNKSDKGDFVMTSAVEVRAIGHGLSQLEMSSSSGSVDSKVIGIQAGNGLIGISQRIEQTSHGKTNTTIYQTTQIDHLKGNLFPVAVGSQFSYRDTTIISPDITHSGDLVNERSCIAVEKRPASEFYRDLSGDAFVFHCEGTYYYTKDPSKPRNANFPYRIYFGELCYFLNVDTIEPKTITTNKGYHMVLTNIQALR
jgi:invasion protein IalB